MCWIWPRKMRQNAVLYGARMARRTSGSTTSGFATAAIPAVLTMSAPSSRLGRSSPSSGRTAPEIDPGPAYGWHPAIVVGHDKHKRPGFDGHTSRPKDMNWCFTVPQMITLFTGPCGKTPFIRRQPRPRLA